MLPPLHRIDSPIQFVHKRDLAWDLDRIEKELSAPDADVGEHAYTLYRLGETRFDLDAGVSAYFKDGAKPTVFHLKRMEDGDWLHVRQMQREGRGTVANEYALYRGLSAVTNGEDNIPLEGPDGKNRMLNAKDAAKLKGMFGREFMEDVGMAVIQASGDLYEREKKP